MAWNDTKWKDRAKEGIAKALCSVFEVEWESTAALDLIRYAYTTESTSPKADRQRNVIYIALSQVQDPATEWGSASYMDDGSVVHRKTIPLSVLLTFYGHDCEEMAEYARSRIMTDTGFGCPRQILRGYHMVPVPPIGSPTAVHEPDEGMWRLRADLRIRINLLQDDYYTFNGVEEIPEIETETN